LGDKYHLRLNIDQRPIANKYREGKVQRTLKRELKGLETFIREAINCYVQGYLFNLKAKAFKVCTSKEIFTYKSYNAFVLGLI